MCFARLFGEHCSRFGPIFRMTPIVVDDHRPQGRGASYLILTHIDHIFERAHSLHQPAALYLLNKARSEGRGSHLTVFKDSVVGVDLT